MGNLALRSVDVDRGLDRKARAIFRRELTGVAWLSAGRCIKDCAVKHDAALFGHCDDAGLAALEIGVLTKQAVRRHRQVFSNGGLMSDLRSSHSGTGNFLERRKSGLNSFD